MSDRDRAALPDTLPIFPLTGVLLLPRGRLPLNIFEPRYLAMTRDALGGERLIGMVQPCEPQQDNRGRGAHENPPVYPVGCAGRITSFSETEDGRYLLTLTGVSRFRVRDELPLLSGYRRIVAEWQPFAHDVETPSGTEFDRDRFIRGLKGFFTQRQISADWEAIEKAAGEHLINSIAMLCPFAPSEKQALLEAPDLNERARLLIALVEMAAVNPNQGFSSEESGATRH
jgi:Lon protease-like protein